MNEHSENPAPNQVLGSVEILIRSGQTWRTLSDFNKWADEEEELRAKHPALRDLWDKYQEVLALCKTSG